MNADELRALQAPIKERYRDEPEAAVVTLRANGTLGGTGISCRVETGRALVDAGLHPSTGGTGELACSGDMLLEALVACAGVTLRAVATAIDVDVAGGTVEAEGELDVRGTLGVDRDAPVGLRAIRLRFALESDADDEQLASLLKLTERYCVVLQTIRGGVDVEAVLTSARS
ncbi:MAG: OsmC family protein [Gaiellales bacterium]